MGKMCAATIQKLFRESSIKTLLFKSPVSEISECHFLKVLGLCLEFDPWSPFSCSFVGHAFEPAILSAPTRTFVSHPHRTDRTLAHPTVATPSLSLVSQERNRFPLVSPGVALQVSPSSDTQNKMLVPVTRIQQQNWEWNKCHGFPLGTFKFRSDTTIFTSAPAPVF